MSSSRARRQRRTKPIRSFDLSLDNETLCATADAILYSEESSGGGTILANEKGRDAFYKVFPALRIQSLPWLNHGEAEICDKDGKNQIIKTTPADGVLYTCWQGVPLEWKSLQHFDVANAARNFGHHLDSINKTLGKSMDDLLSDSNPKAIAMLLGVSMQRQGGVRVIQIDIPDDIMNAPPKATMYDTGGSFRGN
jgi:hypothetical protein